MVAAGERHTVLLKTDGLAVAVGNDVEGYCEIPPLALGENYTQAVAGCMHTVLLKSDGTAVACGLNDEVQC